MRAAGRARRSATATGRFLDKLEAALPFPLAAIQIDGGSEFMTELRTACQGKSIALHVLPPRAPGLNGRVERMQANWRTEFHAVCDPPPQIDRLNPVINAFAQRRNTYQPQDALGQTTPLARLESLRAVETNPSQTR